MIDEATMENNVLDNNDIQTNTILNVSYLTSGRYNTENLNKTTNNNTLHDNHDNDKNKNKNKNKNDKIVLSDEVSASIINKKNNYNKLSNGISNILESSSYKTLFDKESH